MRPDHPSRRAAVVLLATLIVAGCTGGNLADAEQRPPAPAPAAAPPAPPASCLLDAGTLGADTGLMWTPDDATASGRRCIYSPSGDAGLAFVGVDVAPSAGDAATAKLDAPAEVCDDRTR
ncbi:hypothetical protein HF519_29220, partial [Pseudonocardia bannensis]|nr:hypothetical protein [Pseudonocardia bannensis]